MSRSDKKRTVIPLVKIDVKDAIYRLSHVTHTPVKDVCEYLVIYAISDRETISTLSQHFKRDFILNNTYYFGDINAKPIKKRLLSSNGKVTVRFNRNEYEIISALAYALDCTPTRATAILLTSAISNVSAVNAYVRDYLTHELTESQMSDLRHLLRYVNQYVDVDDNHTWLSVLYGIVGEIRPSMRGLREMVAEFIRDKKR